MLSPTKFSITSNATKSVPVVFLELKRSAINRLITDQAANIGIPKVGHTLTIHIRVLFVNSDLVILLAEREGFEPSVPLRVQIVSTDPH